MLYDNGKTVLKLASGTITARSRSAPTATGWRSGELGNHNVEIWDAITRAKVRRLGDGSPGGIGFCTFSPDGQWLSVPEISSRPLRVGTWDLPPSSEFPDTHVNSFSPDARFVLCCEVAQFFGTLSAGQDWPHLTPRARLAVFPAPSRRMGQASWSALAISRQPMSGTSDGSAASCRTWVSIGTNGPTLSTCRWSTIPSHSIESPGELGKPEIRRSKPSWPRAGYLSTTTRNLSTPW